MVGKCGVGCLEDLSASQRRRKRMVLRCEHRQKPFGGDSRSSARHQPPRRPCSLVRPKDARRSASHARLFMLCDQPLRRVRADASASQHGEVKHVGPDAEQRMCVVPLPQLHAIRGSCTLKSVIQCMRGPESALTTLHVYRHCAFDMLLAREQPRAPFLVFLTQLRPRSLAPKRKIAKSGRQSIHHRE